MSVSHLAALAVLSTTILFSLPAEARRHGSSERYAQLRWQDWSQQPRQVVQTRHVRRKARRHRSRHAKVARHRKVAIVRSAIVGRSRSGLVEVQTAAGIKIAVAGNNAWRFVGFVGDLVALRSYRPRQIHCFATGGHVSNSNHYTGNACDVDQRGWGLTASTMYHVRDLTKKWGLRDGCTFRDCGHVDVPRNTAARRERLNLYASLAAFKERMKSIPLPMPRPEIEPETMEANAE